MGDDIPIFDPTTTSLILTNFLPFVIIFAVLYALLEKSKILGASQTAKRLNMVLSLAISATVVLVNPIGINWNLTFGGLFSNSIIIILFLAFVVVFAILFSAARGERSKEGMPKAGILTLIIAIALAVVALNLSGFTSGFLPQGQEFDISQFSPLILLAAVIAVIVGVGYMLTRQEKS